MRKPASPPLLFVRIVRSMPKVMQILCVCLAGAFGVWVMGGESLRLTILTHGGLQPLAFSRGDGFDAARAMSGALGHSFIHASFGHLALNIVGLVLASSWLARLSPEIWRGGRQLALYFGGVAAGVAAHIYFADPQTFMIGASVGVVGLIGGVIYQFTESLHRKRCWQGSLSVLFVVLTVIYSSAVPAGESIAHIPHLAGVLYGIWIFPSFALILLNRERYNTPPS